MSNSTTLLDTISSSQAQKEVTANAMLDAASPATLFGRRATTSAALTWGYYGGGMWVDGVLTGIANGTVALSASTTNYVEATRAGVVSKNTTAFTPGSIPLYTIVTGASSVTSYTDHRLTNTPMTGRLSVSVAGSSNVTLNRAQSDNNILNFTGLLTGNINVIVPNGPQEWDVTNNTTGAYTLTVKTSAGTGIAVAQGKALRVAADGTNVIATQTDSTGMGLGTAALLASDTDGTLAANSDSRIATQKAVKTYVDTAVTGLLDFKGATDCSTNPDYPAASKGDFYVVSVAGKIGGASGKDVDVGDAYYAMADNAGGTEASVGTSWAHVEHNFVIGTMALQNASAVVITGGTIDGVTIGGSTAAAVTATTITANTGMVPDANDGAYLGTTSLGWSDLFLASGAVINWANGDIALTHSTGVLSISKTVNISGDNTGVSGAAATNVLRFTDTDTTTALAQTHGKIEFYSTDGSFGGSSVQSYMLSSARGSSAGGDFRFGVTANASPTFVESLIINELGLIVPTASTFIFGSNDVVFTHSTGKVVSSGAFLSSAPTGGLGYATGAGGAVAQATSRTTGVTLNKVSGDITLVSDAGSATWQSFTVTDSAIAATDSVRVVQKSGADKYMIFVTAVAAGSFEITFATTGGTTTEQPVVHFDVFKGVTS